MQPIYIEIENFKTIKSLKLDLTEYLNKTTLISGENTDCEGAASNLTGKTNFMKAMVWCPFGIGVIDDSNDEIIHYGEKQCRVLQRYNNGIEIERVLKGKTQSFFYRMNGKDMCESNADAQAAFLKDIGITSKNSSVISNSIYLNSSANTIITCTPTERLKVLTDWFNLNEYDSKIEEGKEKVKELDYEMMGLRSVLELPVDLSDKEEKKIGVESDIKKAEEALVKLEVAQKDFNEFQTLKNELKSLLQLQTNIERQNREILEAKEKASTYDGNALIEGIRTYEGHVIELNTNMSKTKQEMDTLSRLLSGSKYSCPVCGTDLISTNGKLEEYDSKKATEQLAELKGKYSELDKQVNETKPKITELKKKQTELNNLNFIAVKPLQEVDTTRSDELQEKLKTEPRDWSGYIATYKQNLRNLNQDLGRLEQEIKTILDNRIKKEKAESRVTELDKEIKLYKLWIGDRQKPGLLHDIKMFKLTRSVTNLELITNNYLKSLFKINSGISLTFTSKGIDLKQEGDHPISSASGGERARMAFSIALALNKLYSTNLDLILIDEFFGALDQTGMQVTMEVLDKVAGMKFVISHVPCQCENEIELVKRNGVTSLKS